jgi:hypothetical protein
LGSRKHRPGYASEPIFAASVAVIAVRMIGLGRRVARLEKLLSDDDADLAALAELDVALRLDEPPGDASSVREGPIAAGVRDAIAGYQLADYSLEEARGLAREVLRLEVKRAGGWTP